MTTTAIRLFVDTNAFIQLRDLKDLPWRELFPAAAAIDILVSQTVIDELDRLKTGTNERRRNRARLALRLINTASEDSGFNVTLPHNALDLRLVIAMGAVPDWSALPKLDRNRADDQLVAEVITFGNGAALLSHDSGPRIRARIMGIQAYEPPETWLLPEERTDDQRKIAQLERMLENALSDRPRILASLGTLDEPRESFEFFIPVVEPLPETMQAKLVSAYLDRHPPRRREERRELAMLVSPMGDSASSYNRKLDRFEDEVKKYFASLHQMVSRAGRAVPIYYAVKNDSGVAAQGLRIEMHVDGDASLFAEQEDAESFFGVRGPPALPVFDDGLSSLSHMHRVNALSRALSQPRDPTAFYWFTRPKYGDAEGALQCTDFRATRLWESDIWVCPDGKEPCTLRLDVSATNLPSPVVRTASISIEEKPSAWTDKIVHDLLPEEVRTLLQAAV